MAIDPSSSIALRTLQPTRHPLPPLPALLAARKPWRHNFGRTGAGLFVATSAFAYTASHRLRSKSRNGTGQKARAELATEKQEAQDVHHSDDDFQSASRLGIRRLKLWPGIDDVQYDFGGLPIPKRLMDAFAERGIKEASMIQRTVMHKLSLGEHGIIHAPTGSGKTIAYLLPLMARLQPTMHVGAQALILVPTQELVVQVAHEAKWLVEVLSGEQGVCWFNPQVPQKLACEALLSRSVLWDAIRSDTAMLVTTPGIITAELKQLRREARRFSETLAFFMGSNIQSIVLDEVDTMCPNTNNHGRRPVIGTAEQVMEYVVDVVRVRYRNHPTQLISASATASGRKVARLLDRILERKYGKRRDIARRTSPQLFQAEDKGTPLASRRKSHVAMPQKIEHATLTLKQDDFGDIVKGQRFAIVTRIVSGLVGRGTVLVCVPDRIKMDDMIRVLEDAKIKNVFKYRALVGLSLPPDAEDEQITPSDCLYQLGSLSNRLSGSTDNVLVAKMNACRGINLQDVRYVVLFALPDTAGDYLHLAGRTGRMGKPGTTISLITEREEDNILPRFKDKLGITFTKWDLERESSTQDHTSQSGEQEFKQEGNIDSKASREDMAASSETSTLEDEATPPAEKPKPWTCSQR
eukprot:TRINITY_DN16039_c0_g1_i1.p1 TRINITY_DN16039_c0_g1~~TRINITY_DN16039_c0_g1_i1.p1  ORF type:complete len:637 (-),score=70.08 TRINITY_DN16039_c0_g1_i1:380-2290(-)